MFHFDGARWSPVRRPPESQFAILGQGTDVFVSTLSGWVLERLAPW